MHARFLPLFLSLFACYQPDYDAAHFRCGAGVAEACPEGFTCQSSGFCERSGAGSNGPADMRTIAPDDLQAPPDLQEVPCPEMVKKIASGVYACKGSFTAATIDKPCGPSLHACTAADSDKLLSRQARDGCNQLMGFFTTKIPTLLKQDDMGFLYINCDGNDGSPALLGCGTETGEVTVLPRDSCHLLDVTLQCIALPTGWSCSQGITDVAHKDPNRGGVLCCRN